jgi:CheY-like chemotaxis protein
LPFVLMLLVADSAWVRNDVEAALPSSEWSIHHSDPRVVVEAAQNHPPEVVLIDMQIGSMGGMAVVRRLREAIAMRQIKPTRLVLMLDRAADGFLAKRAGADASVLKPFTAQELRQVLFAD